MAERTGAVVLLKGAGSVIADPAGATAINPSGGPLLASGGTGDVRWGMVTVLLAQGLPAFEAARLGAYLHGAAADRLATRRGSTGSLAGEVAAEIPALLDALRELAADAARALSSSPGGVDVEIVERHHRFKEDSPSGTALKFGELIAAEMGQTSHVHGREGRIGQRPQDEIGYHALRTGDNVGEHTIVFGMIGETIDLTVRGQTRDSYAYGAVAAAAFLAGQAPGTYTMNDVLGL